MRTQKLKLLWALVVLFTISLVQGQESTKQLFWIHEDVVKPSMSAEYESTIKELVSNFKKHDIKNVNHMSFMTDDNRYLFLAPITTLSEANFESLNDLSTKMGEEAMGAIFKRMSKCYDVEHDYTIELDKELSYQPSGVNIAPEGKPFRVNTTYYYTPENKSKVMEIAKRAKAIFSAKNSKMDYRVYHSGFGVKGAYIMTTVAAENPEAYEKLLNESLPQLGQEWVALWGDLMAVTMKLERVRFMSRPDLSFKSAK